MELHRTRSQRLVACGAVALLLLSACSSKPEDKVTLYPVRGKVTFDGKPTEGATLTLWALKSDVKLDQAPTAYVKPDGTFVVGTTAAENGAPAGEYEVSILWFPPNARQITQSTGKMPELLLPKMYSDPKKSGLKITVREEPNDLPEFQLQK